MFKRLLYAAALAAGLFLAPKVALADVGNVTAGGTITTTGVPVATIGSVPLGLQGQSFCWVTIGGSPSGLSLLAQESPDFGLTWQTVTAINSGSAITSTGTYGGSVIQSNSAPTLFRITVSAYTSGATTFVLGCGPFNTSGAGLPTTVTISNPAPTTLTGTAVAVAGVQGPNSNSVGVSIFPLDQGGAQGLINAGCSKFLSVAGGATTVVSATPVHFCGYQIQVALTTQQFGCWANSSALSGTELAASAVGAGIITVPIAGGKTWATPGLTCGSASGGLGTATVFYDT